MAERLKNGSWVFGYSAKGQVDLATVIHHNFDAGTSVMEGRLKVWMVLRDVGDHLDSFQRVEVIFTTERGAHDYIAKQKPWHQSYDVEEWDVLQPDEEPST